MAQLALTGDFTNYSGLFWGSSTSCDGGLGVSPQTLDGSELPFKLDQVPDRFKYIGGAEENAASLNREDSETLPVVKSLHVCSHDQRIVERLEIEFEPRTERHARCLHAAHVQLLSLRLDVPVYAADFE